MAEDKKDQGFTKEQLEELQIDSALGGDIPFVGMVGIIGRKGIKVISEEVVESSPKILAKAKELAGDASEIAHRLFTPQNPTGKTMEAFKEKLNGTDINAVIKEQLKAVPGGWIGLGGGSALAASAVVSHEQQKRADEIATRPLPEQKAIAFDEAAGITKEEVKAVSRFQDLQPYFDKYHQLRAEALQKNPVINGHSDAATAEIYRGKQALIQEIKHPEVSSAVDALPIETKLALAKTAIDSMPQDQQEIMHKQLAAIAYGNGMNKEQQVTVAEQGQERTS